MAKQHYQPTLAYEDFVKNLANIDAKPSKMEIYYNRGDSRCWTALLNPGTDNVMVTYHINKDHMGDRCIDILSSDKTITGIEPEYAYDIIDEILTPSTPQDN